jgi:hypothetical protein
MSILRTLALTSLALLPPLVFACGSKTTGNSATDDGGSGSSSGTSSGATTSGSSSGTQGGSSGSNGFAEASHAPFPTVANQGVAAMASPKIVALTFGTDANAAGIASFVGSLGSSAYWSSVTSQYGVGAATGSQMTSSAAIASSYTDTSGTQAAGSSASTFQTFVSGTLAAANLPPDPSTVYAFFLPSSTTIQLQIGSSAATTCDQVGGYHNAAAASNGSYYYAVIPECAGATLGPVGQGRLFGSEIDLITFEASHEIIEAVTDPSISQTDASFTAGWYNDFPHSPVDDFAWNEASDGEIADFCVDQFGAFSNSYHDVATAGTSTVQRIWSVSAAAAGQNPCIPVPSGEIYFNAAPKEGTDLLIVTQNEATTMEVDAFSDAAKSWQVYALDGAEIFQGATTANLELSFAGGSTEQTNAGALAYIAASNGSKLELSVTLVASLSLPDNPFALGVLISQDGTDIQNAKNDHYWPFIVTTTAIAAQENLGLTTGRVHLGASEWGRVTRAMKALKRNVHDVR